ncbi:putative WRKY transcription factor 3 [Hibiscus syriacus]|uniref:WRKY transcription factor 3 n=1 Tax=Hibiscus syriacus TaxID=106335 RepID=A0A6A3D418_HIBSY|nr:probable WRKY transcription factor 3 [Hibiscus syriacus]KAE8734588.1 putative WRKY transcription factor 3 [Hibiscus syriacus]
MADDENHEQKPSKPLAPSKRPVITPPPQPFTEAFFNGGTGFMGLSPGPMTLVSNYFSGTDDFKSFSQLLAGAMASPAAVSSQRLSSTLPTAAEDQGDVNHAEDGVEGGLRFKQNKPAGLVITQPVPQPFYEMPQGLLSPASLLESPGFSVFSPGAQGPFGMTHQQALAQVTAQAAQAHSHSQIHAESSLTPPSSLALVSSFTANTDQEVPTSLQDSNVTMKQPSDVSQSNQRSQSASLNVDRPADDGYNWRKYGQKQVKGSEFPRSYYKCTHPGCPVKKKVERSLDGQVTEIIYKGQHNHQTQLNKRAKGSGSLSGTSNNQGIYESTSQLQSGNMSIIEVGTSGYSMSKKDQESSLATAERISRTSDSDVAGDNETGADKKDEDEPDSKRQNSEIRVSDPSSSHRTVTEPRIILQTRSEVDLLDDGYRWRKYGQKVVKGNPYPRSYYKCTTPGCNVRKHVERASTDPKAVITTYEGKHNHDVPASKTSSHNTANTDTSKGRTHNIATDNRGINNSTNSRQQEVARLRLKEEDVT